MWTILNSISWHHLSILQLVMFASSLRHKSLLHDVTGIPVAFFICIETLHGKGATTIFFFFLIFDKVCLKSEFHPKWVLHVLKKTFKVKFKQKHCLNHFFLKRSKGRTYLYIYWWFYPGWPWSTQSCHTFQDRKQETEWVTVAAGSTGWNHNIPAVAHLTHRQHKIYCGKTRARIERGTTWERLRLTAFVCCRRSSSSHSIWGGSLQPRGQTPCCLRPAIYTHADTRVCTHTHIRTQPSSIFGPNAS